MLERILGTILFIFMGLVLLTALTFPLWAQARDHYNQGIHGSGNPRFYSDIQNPPDMIIYQDHRDSRYGYDRRPRYYSDIEQQPDLIIYPGRRSRR